MPTTITNLGNKPVTLPLQPAALVPPGKRVVYASQEPAAIIAALGGGETVRKMNLDVRPIGAALAPSDIGLCPVLYASGSDLAAVKQAALVVGAEAANAIPVSGQVKDGLGVNVAAATDVVVRVFAPTASKGAITVVTGTQKVNTSGAGKVQECWLQTDATGAFAVSIADDVAEACLFVVEMAGRSATALLTFA